MKNKIKICKSLAAALAVLPLLILTGCNDSDIFSIIWPTLPEGPMYLYEERLAPVFGTDCVLVNTDLDNYLVPNPNNPAEFIAPHTVLFLMNSMWENGFILTIDPDNPEENPARISVALHARAFNFTPETWNFINEDPDNLFITYTIMDGLVGGSGLGFMNAVSTDISIRAGGHHQLETKEGADEFVTQLYDQVLPFPLNLLSGISEEEFRGYFSQLLYKETYVGGQEVTLSQFLEMFREPRNWSDLQFQVTVDLIMPRRNLMTGIQAGSGNPYQTGSLALNQRIYLGAAGGSQQTGYRIRSFPSELGGRQTIRTYLEDAGAAGEDFLTFNLASPATLYLALDINHPDPSPWVNAGWTPTAWTVTVGRPPSYTDTASFLLYEKDCTGLAEYPAQVSIPGNNSAGSKMYFVIADAGTFPFGINIIASAHANLMTDDPAEVGLSEPGTHTEGGIVVNENGITVDPATGLPLVHADFVEEFDANVFVNTEGGATGQLALADLTDRQLVEHILANNGFRLIDTYNDQYPAFGAGSQVLQVENFLGIAVDPIRVELLEEDLETFTNMDLLNSPNLNGVYLKSVFTDAGIQVWRDEETNKGLNYAGLMGLLDTAQSYTFFLSRPNNPISKTDFLKQLGRSEEGELTLGILITLPEGKKLEIRAGFFRQDYFTDVYDPVIGNFVLPAQ